jgi:type I restriction-modification system DNA methylase subunit
LGVGEDNGQITKERKFAATKQQNGANLGFEAKLWATADALRNNMDAAEYEHVVLGVISGELRVKDAEKLAAAVA